MPKRKSSSASEEPTFDVECINEARVTKIKHWEYYIKWGGYPDSENTWEPERNLEGCQLMMQDFWEQVGSSNKAQAKFFPIGHTLAPTKQWIKSKRKAYEKKKKEETETDETDEEEETSHNQLATLHLSSDDTDGDDIPLSQKVSSQKFGNASKSNLTANRSSSKRKRPDIAAIERRESSPELPKKLFKATSELPSFKHLSLKGKEKETDDVPSPRDPLFDSDSDDAPLASKLPTATAPSQTSSQPPQPQSLSAPRPSLSIETSQPKERPIAAHVQRKLFPRVKLMAPPTDVNAGGLGGISTKARIASQGRSPSSALPAGSPLSSNVPASSPLVSKSPEVAQPSGSSQPLDAMSWLNENVRPREQLVRRDSEYTDQPSVDLPSSNSGSFAQQGLHFSKKWRWTGQLAVGDNESEDGFAEPVGRIVLTDNTALDLKAGQIGIHVLISSNEDSICLRHQYSITVLHMALADFKISQFARMTADPSSDENSFDDLVVYMTKHELFSQTPLFVGDSQAARMFVFPASLSHLWDRLAVPAKIRQADGLLVAIGFQAFVPPKRGLGGFTETYHSKWKTEMRLEAPTETRSLDLSRALLVLKFPEGLFKRLAHKECTIFTTPADRTVPGPDSLALATIIEHAPDCKLVPVLTGSARFIFIHVSAWEILHKLPGLVDRRLRRPDIQFYTYGSDAMVERKWWNVREVFPIGGIVTFTPRAIAEDPEGVEKLIAKIDEHPLWACYVIPPVVAMIVEVVNLDSGPNSKLKNVIDALCGILSPIEKGQIALTWQPPSRTAHYRERDSDPHLMPQRVDWMIDQAHLSELRGHELVFECQKRFRRSQDRSEKEVETRMVKDLLAMQLELREEYRRFVIITDTSGACNTSREVAASTSASKADIKDGFEFTHVNDFAFNDDYYADERK